MKHSDRLGNPAGSQVSLQSRGAAPATEAWRCVLTLLVTVGPSRLCAVTVEGAWSKLQALRTTTCQRRPAAYRLCIAKGGWPLWPELAFCIYHVDYLCVKVWMRKFADLLAQMWSFLYWPFGRRCYDIGKALNVCCTVRLTGFASQLAIRELLSRLWCKIAVRHDLLKRLIH